MRRTDDSRFPALVTAAGVYRAGVPVGIIGVSTNLGTALRPLLERSTDAGPVVRSDAVVTYAGPAERQPFGRSDQEIIGRSSASVMTTLPHPEDRPAPGRLLRRILAEPGGGAAGSPRAGPGVGWRPR